MTHTGVMSTPEIADAYDEIFGKIHIVIGLGGESNSFQHQLPFHSLNLREMVFQLLMVIQFRQLMISQTLATSPKDSKLIASSLSQTLAGKTLIFLVNHLCPFLGRVRSVSCSSHQP